MDITAYKAREGDTVRFYVFTGEVVHATDNSVTVRWNEQNPADPKDLFTHIQRDTAVRVGMEFERESNVRSIKDAPSVNRDEVIAMLNTPLPSLPRNRGWKGRFGGYQ